MKKVMEKIQNLNGSSKIMAGGASVVGLLTLIFSVVTVQLNALDEKVDVKIKASKDIQAVQNKSFSDVLTTMQATLKTIDKRVYRIHKKHNLSEED